MTNGAGGPLVPPGWYPDGDGWERYWDGSGWTADRRPVQQGRSPWAPPSVGAPSGQPSAAPTAFPPSGPPGAPPNGPPGGYAGGYPPSPAPGGPYGGPGGPSYPGPAAPRKSLLWLWIVLAVVLVVLAAAAVTLLVTQPWDDDGPGSKGDPTTQETEDGAQVVTGDLDGDGRGDVLGHFRDDAENRLTLTNTQGSFEVAAQPVETEEKLLVADFDGDGTADVGSWFDSSGTLQFEVEDSDYPTVTHDFELWFQTPTVGVVSGDFDGDGRTDLAAYGQIRRSLVAVWVLRNNGEGFEAPTRWATLQNASFGSVEPIPGDFNGDGSDDIMAVVPDEPLQSGDFKNYYWYGDYGVSPLVSSGGEFAVGTVVAIEAELYDQEYAVGDFDGDGTDALISDNYFEDEFVALTFDGTTLRPSGATISYQISGDGVMDAMVASDVDGDGLDDLVFTSVDIDNYEFSGAWVSAAGESGLGPPERWAAMPECPTDYCAIDFYAS